jgi:tetratricopeptide (TPR) repeat protein
VKHYLQYFNVEKMGRFPNGADGLLTTRMGVFTKLAAVRESKGSTVFVIAGLGKPKRYYLWEAFTVEEVTHDGEQYTATGPGWILYPPQRLEGKAFDNFKAACAHFIGFRAVDELPYGKTLRNLADKFHLPDVNAACEAFCDELIKLEPKNGDSYYYRAGVRQKLGKADAAREDYKKAIEVGTNFAREAAAAVAGKAADGVGAAAPKDKTAAGVVAKGRFAKSVDAATKKPAGVPETLWLAVQQRRGEEELRQQLLKAYGGRCAITGSDGEAALEVALIRGADGSGPQEVTNSLLLRGDVRTLFDLNLIRVHPKSRKVFVADALKRSSYARLVARQLRLPERKEDRPNSEALQQRWDAAEA